MGEDIPSCRVACIKGETITLVGMKMDGKGKENDGSKLEQNLHNILVH